MKANDCTECGTTPCDDHDTTDMDTETIDDYFEDALHPWRAAQK